MSRSSSVTPKKNVIKFLTKVGYCNCSIKYQPNKVFCMTCGKPHMPEIKRATVKGKYTYKIRCPYCKKLYTLNSYKKHIKTKHTNAIKAHIKAF